MTTPTAPSAFGPLQILFLTLALWLSYHVWEIHRATLAQRASERELLPHAKAALAEQERLLNLIHDLQETAKKDPVAAQILQEFKIRPENP
jgi:hypothetical protein